MKKETLEEAADRHYYGNPYENFIRGAQWQQEEDKNKYSEEEVLDVLRDFYRTFDAMKNPPQTSTIPLWFNEFKKK